MFIRNSPDLNQKSDRSSRCRLLGLCLCPLPSSLLSVARFLVLLSSSARLRCRFRCPYTTGRLPGKVALFSASRETLNPPLRLRLLEGVLLVGKSRGSCSSLRRFRCLCSLLLGNLGGVIPGEL